MVRLEMFLIIPQKGRRRAIMRCLERSSRGAAFYKIKAVDTGVRDGHSEFPVQPVDIINVQEVEEV
ncbi:MAG: hypothetical protein R6U50_11935 [Desulfobacterales bacterium]